MRVRAFASYGEKIMRMWITHFVGRCVSGALPLFLLMKPLIPSVPAAAFAVCSLACPFAPVQAGEAARTSYDIAPGDAVNTLKRFADESGRQVVFLVDAVRGVTTNPVRGEYTVREALTRLVADTGLVVAEDAKSGALMVNRLASREPPPSQPEPQPNAMSTKPRNLLATFAGWLAATSMLDAQNVASLKNEDQAVTLTPFTVSASKDNGYAATETLAGTRLRTNLRDIASSMSVLTPELLRDLGANSIDEAIAFMPSSDKVVVDGNATGAANMSGWNYRFSASQQFSIRGIPVQGFSSDFFDTLATSDFYNTERVTVARGPNSILFGVGGPAGSVITSTKRPQLGRAKSQIALQTDRWGSFRSSFDHNQPIVKDRLALRFNALHEDRLEFRNNEGQWQDRATISVTAKPFKNTTITAHHENWRFDRNYAPLNTWFSNGVMQWIAAGRPTVDFVPAGSAWGTAGRTFVDANGRPVPVAAGVADADGFVDAKADFDPRNGVAQNTAQNFIYMGGLNLAQPLWNLRFQPTINNDVFDGVNGFSALSNVPNPLSILGIPLDANLNPGSKDRPSFESSGRWTQVFVEQKLADKLFLELAANQGFEHRYFIPHQYNLIKIDVAKYQPDGSANPGYLQPYGDAPATVYDWNTGEKTLRATLSYEVDATRWHRWLGRHSLALLGQYGERTHDRYFKSLVNKGGVGAAGFATDPTAGQHLLTIRQYFVNGAVPSALVNAKDLVEAVATLAAQGRLKGATAAEQVALNLDARGTQASILQETINRGQSFAWQGSWLRDRLVTTFGVRKDSAAFRNGTGGRTDYDPAVPIPATFPAGLTLANYSYFTPPGSLALPATPREAGSTTRTFAGVLHATTWFSLTYNQSENFVPAGETNLDWMGRTSKNSRGETKDYGFKLFLLDNRLVVSANHFTNDAVDRNNAGRLIAGGIDQIMQRLRTNYREKGDSHFTAMSANPLPPELSTARTYGDIAGKGDELSVTFNPNQNWRLMLTGSRNRTVISNQFPDVAEFLYTENQYSAFAGFKTWNRFVAELNKVAAGQRSAQFDLDPANSVHVQQARDDAAFLAQNIASQERRYVDSKATDGAVQVQNGEYALNSAVTYSFTREGWFKGWQIGGNARWRSAPIAGYYRFPNATAGSPEGVIDVTRPIKGDTFIEFGGLLAYQRRILSNRVGLRVQLNIENLLDAEKPLLKSVGTDSGGVYGSQFAYVPLRWEFRRPRNFKLSATFDF